MSFRKLCRLCAKYGLLAVDLSATLLGDQKKALILPYKLGSLIKKYKFNSFNLTDIALLSPCIYGNSIIVKSKALEHICGVSMINDTAENTVIFSTIQGFKGLESKVVILVDIDKISNNYFEKILYIGISRAKVNLFIFCEPEIKKILDERYIAGVKKFR